MLFSIVRGHCMHNVNDARSVECFVCAHFPPMKGSTACQLCRGRGSAASSRYGGSIRRRKSSICALRVLTRWFACHSVPASTSRQLSQPPSAKTRVSMQIADSQCAHHFLRQRIPGMRGSRRRHESVRPKQRRQISSLCRRPSAKLRTSATRACPTWTTSAGACATTSRTRASP